VSDTVTQANLDSRFTREVQSRIDALAASAEAGGFDDAIALFVSAIERGGVIQAFGTGHSEAFAMEIAGRAGGLIPTKKIALRDVVLRGSLDISALGGSSLERNPDIADELYAIADAGPDDVFVIASNSGVNGTTFSSSPPTRGSTGPSWGSLSWQSSTDTPWSRSRASTTPCESTPSTPAASAYATLQMW